MSEPVWIHDRVALAAHRQVLARHGGLDARVDRVRLSMALAWPKSLLALAGRPVKLIELAGAYVAGVLRMRPFAEGNERSAYLLGSLFLGLNDVFLRASPHEKLAMFSSLVHAHIPLSAYVEWLGLRYLADRHGAATVVHVKARRDGSITGMSVLKTGPAAGKRKDPPLPGQSAAG